MLSYVYFGTNDLERAIEFYNAVLGTLGMRRCVTGDAQWDRVAAGWGIYEDGGARELAFWVGKPFDQQPATVGNGSMVAFSARFTCPGQRIPCSRVDARWSVRWAAGVTIALRAGFLCGVRQGP